MNIEEKLRHLAMYRLKQAEESIDEAKYLFQGNKSSRSVVNRAYYAMFYAIMALLVFEPYSSSKHSGILSYFNRTFIKSGKMSKELGKAVNKAFDLRQRSDYREEFIISPGEAEPFIGWAEMFVSSAKDYQAIKSFKDFIERSLCASANSNEAGERKTIHLTEGAESQRNNFFLFF